MNFLRSRGAALALLLLALGFIALGIWQGEAEIVLRKATTICMECIGLG